MEQAPTEQAVTQIKNRMGAPMKLTRDSVDKAKEYYLNVAVDRPEKHPESGVITGVEVNLPTKEGLALYLGVTRKTLYNWAEEDEAAWEHLTDEEAELKKDFLYIFDCIMSEQAKRLINKGLAGKYNSLIGKLLLGKHGYKDMTDMTTNDEPIAAVQFEIVKPREAVTPAAKAAVAAKETPHETKITGNGGAGPKPGGA